MESRYSLHGCGRGSLYQTVGCRIWAANHLPKVHYAEDVVFAENSTLESVARLFAANPKFRGKNYVHERQSLRIIIQEQLEPLKSLTNAKDIGQVFVDVACGMCVPSASWLLSVDHGPFSSPLALCVCWDHSSQPQSQQHHVPLYQGGGCGRK